MLSKALRQKTGHPRSNRQQKFFGIVALSAIGGDGHSRRRRVKCDYFFAELQFSPAILGRPELCADASFHEEIAAAFVQKADFCSVHGKLRKPAMKGVSRTKDFVRDVISFGGGHHVIEELVDTMDHRLVWVPSDGEAAALDEEALACRGFNLPPKLVRAQRQRGVLHTFADRDPCQPGLATR